MFEKHGGYICGYLTILDFFYYETVFYGANIIGETLKELPVAFELAKKYKKFF